MSIRSKIKLGAVSVLSVAALASSVAFATGASASTTNVANHPTPLPVACQTHLRQSNDLTLQFQGQPFSYQVRLRLVPVLFQRGVLAFAGTLCDTHEPSGVPLILPVHGVLFGGNVVVFSVRYPLGSVQGVRTFSMLVGPHGGAIGSWSETGFEAGEGTVVLQRI